MNGSFDKLDSMSEFYHVVSALIYTVKRGVQFRVGTMIVKKGKCEFGMNMKIKLD